MQRPVGNVEFNTRKGPRTNFNRHDLNAVILPDSKAFSADEERKYVTAEGKSFSVGEYSKRIEYLSTINFDSKYSADEKAKLERLEKEIGLSDDSIAKVKQKTPNKQ